MVIITLVACSKTDVKSKRNIEFEELFKSISSVSINGGDTPIYSLKDLLVIGDTYIILDKVNNKIISYNTQSEETEFFGNEGRGPKEFLSPELLIEGADSTYFVLDGMGNLRFSHFNMSGELLNTFPVNSLGPFTNSYYLTKQNKSLFYITTATNCLTNSGNNCAIDVLNNEGKVLFNFAETNKLEDKPIGLPYYSAIVGSEIFVVHVFSSSIYKYSLDGDYKDSFTILNSNYANPPSLGTLSKSTFEQVNQLRSMSYTAVSGLFTADEYLIVEYIRKGDEYRKKGLSKYFLEFYDINGNLLLEGINTESRLYHVRNDEFYFASIENNADGKLNIEKYIYKGNIISE